jgi:predicted metal-dependent peptidase
MELDPGTAAAVSAALTGICQRNAFFGALALYARVEVSARVATAATDGRDIFVNPGFFGRLSRAEQEGLLLHEVLHAALEHVPRRGGRDPKLWNIAADIVVNAMVARAGYELPTGGVRNTGLEHLSVEEVYERLLSSGKAPELPQPDLLAAPPEDTGGAGEGAGAKQAEAGAGEEAPAGGRDWEQARRQARMVAEGSVHGELPAGLARELEGIEAGRLDWRSRLWRYLVRTPADFQGFDRRFVGAELYLDALDSETVQVAVAVDTSGSIDRGMLARFLGELQAILRAYPHLRCDLYYADAALHGPHRLRAGGPVPPPVGGGGTDFRPFFTRLAGEVRRGRAPLAIYLTDGYGRFPTDKPRHPTLWVLTPGGADGSRLPFGAAVRLMPSDRSVAYGPPAAFR